MNGLNKTALNEIQGLLVHTKLSVFALKMSVVGFISAVINNVSINN